MGVMALLAAAIAIAADDEGSSNTEPAVRALVVTGGHDFERGPFFAMFDAMEGISWKEAQHPAANTLYTPEAAKSYDVLVLYDMNQNIDDTQKAQLLRLVKEDGKGVVSLHHSIANYQNWPEYHEMTGVRYYLEDTVVDGVKKPKSTYDHDQTFRVQIVDPKHPATLGMSDFEIVDETYNGFDVLPGVTPLLRTDYPKSGPLIGWAKTYGNARVVYIQLGHGPTAFENPNYRRLVRNAMVWVSEDGKNARN